MKIKTCNLIIDYNLKYIDEFKNLKYYKTNEIANYSINTLDNEIKFDRNNLIKSKELYKLYEYNGIIYQENYSNNRLIGVIQYNKKDINIYMYIDNYYNEYVLSQYAYVYLIDNYTNYTYIHSSSIKYNDSVYLLLGKSGVGKSTLRRNFLDTTSAICINDDKNIIGIVNDKLHVFNSIYAGKEYISTNSNGELKALIFLEQGKENRLIKIDKIEVLKRLIGQMKLPTNKNKDNWNLIFDKLLNTNSYIYENIISKNTAIDLLNYIGGNNNENQK